MRVLARMPIAFHPFGSLASSTVRFPLRFQRASAASFGCSPRAPYQRNLSYYHKIRLFVKCLVISPILAQGWNGCGLGSTLASRVVVGAPADHCFSSPLLPMQRAEEVGEGADCQTPGAWSVFSVAQTSKSAVSRVSKPAGCNAGRRLGSRRYSRFGNLRYAKSAAPR
jgi:hypothetical protein